MIGMALAAQAGWRKVGPAVTATMAKVPEAAQSLRDPKTDLHVSSAHRVSDGRIAFKEAPAICAAGYDVTVLGLHRADGMRLPRRPRFVQYAPPESRPRRFLLRLPWLLVYCLRHPHHVYHLHAPDPFLHGFFLQ